MFHQPRLEVLILLPGLDGGEGDGATERVAELHRAEPVELEAAVEIAPAADLGEGHGAGIVILVVVVEGVEEEFC